MKKFKDHELIISLEKRTELLYKILEYYQHNGTLPNLSGWDNSFYIAYEDYLYIYMKSEQAANRLNLKLYESTTKRISELFFKLKQQAHELKEKMICNL